MYNAFKYAVLYKMMVRLICGYLSTQGVFISTPVNDCISFLANGVAAAIDLCQGYDIKASFTPAGKAFQALRRTGVSPMGMAGFFGYDQ